jgi:hypothetical protein
VVPPRTYTFGFHDWDVQASHRYLVLLSLFRFTTGFPRGIPSRAGLSGVGLRRATIVPEPASILALALRIEVPDALIGAARGLQPSRS